MEGEHAQMWQIPCKMTNSSSKPLQTLGKWYQPRNPQKNPKPVPKKIPKKIPKTISHPFSRWLLHHQPAISFPYTIGLSEVGV